MRKPIDEMRARLKVALDLRDSAMECGIYLVALPHLLETKREELLVIVNYAATKAAGEVLRLEWDIRECETKGDL